MEAMDQHSFIASSRELDGLVFRVRYLCIAGFIMSLNINCEDERAVVDLHVDLGFIQPSVEILTSSASFMSPNPMRISSRSSSYYHRLRGVENLVLH